MKRLEAAFKAFDHKKVMIIGDVMVDAYQWGSVNRISPEAPVPIVSSTNRESRLGGAANVALNIKALGGIPVVCSVIGKDKTGHTLKHLFNQKNNISTQYIIESESRITTLKTRVLSQYQQLLRIDEEQDMYLDSDLEEVFIANVKKAIDDEEICAVIFEDYDKGVITPKVIKEVVAYCNQNGLVSLCDPKHRNFSYYKDITVFKPNFKEFCAGIHQIIPKNDFDNLKIKAKNFRKENNFKNLIVTLSEHGVLVDGESSVIIPAEKRDISDVSGAGDTVISVLTMCLCGGMDIVTASKVANIAGGLVCEKIGIVPVNKDQLLVECKKVL